MENMTEAEWKASIEVQVARIEKWAAARVAWLRSRPYEPVPDPDIKMRQILAENPGISQMAFIKLSGGNSDTAREFLKAGIDDGRIRLEFGKGCYGNPAHLHTLVTNS